jgi:ethanolamine ammonia-lyase small subunit
LSEPGLRPPSLLRNYTAARVGLRRTGAAISTRDQLRFQLDHARARDAVHDQPDFAALMTGVGAVGLNALLLDSAVPPGEGARTIYLRRPDLGRRLSVEAAERLRKTAPAGPTRLSIVIADGLSGLAVDRHALPLLRELLTLPGDAPNAPVAIVRNARVAVGDEIGALLHAEMTILLIGERPGLTAPDSLGVYLTSHPHPGKTDAERNCISNIRHDGLSYADAARQIAFFLNAIRLGSSTGFALKDSASPNLHAIG